MNKFEQVDVLDALQKIMKQHTAFYQSDFDIDKSILRRAALSDSKEDKTYLWMSRPSGTHCLRERDVLLKDTYQHNTFCFYAEQTTDKVLAYAVTLTGTEGSKLIGNLYELDYREHVRHIQQEALQADTVTLHYEYGDRQQPAKQFISGEDDRVFGKFIGYEVQPNDPDALHDLLQQEKREHNELPKGDLQSHIQTVRDGKVTDEAQRIADAFQKLGAPNSPNKTHFMVELSPHFMALASSKEQDRLLSMLPYKSLCLSSMKERHKVYALISKDENRSLPLRKLRPSVRDQLKDGQQKAAPKKAAAKSKNHELEV